MNELTNLLPRAKWRAVWREYYTRLAVVVLIFASILIGVGSLFLLPTHQFLQHEMKIEREALAKVVSNANGGTLDSQVKEIATSVTRIAALRSALSVSDTLNHLLDVSRAGIKLSSVSISVTGKGNQAVLVGSASTRETLRAYQLALQAEPYIASASLPLSVYTKETNVPFVITIQLTTP